jgi:hypothetical protein
LRGAKEVETVRELGSGDVPGCDHGGERDHRAAVVFDVELVYVRGVDAAAGLRLQEHLPLPAEAVELVDVDTAEERLERLVDVADLDPLLQDLVAVDVGVDLRDVRPPHAVDVGELRALARGLEELLQVLVQELDAAAAAVLEPEREAARVPSPGWPAAERRTRRLGDLLAERAVDCARSRRRAARLPALVPRVERDEVERGVRRGRAESRLKPATW